MFFNITLFLNVFITLNLFSAIFMFCNSTFEEGNLDLQCYINALLLLLLCAKTQVT